MAKRKSNGSASGKAKVARGVSTAVLDDHPEVSRVVKWFFSANVLS